MSYVAKGSAVHSVLRSPMWLLQTRIAWVKQGE